MNSPVTERQGAYRDALIKKRAELGSLNQPLRVSLNNSARKGDMADKADGNNEVHIALRMRQTDIKILCAIEDALQRFEKGTYGICRDCGEEIAAPRLNAIPWTRVCIVCKEKKRR
jgi:DnaK suppressor protein